METVSVWAPRLDHRRVGSSGIEVRIGHDWVDDYLRFVASRCRPNTVLAVGFDLLVFFRAADGECVASPVCGSGTGRVVR